MARLMAERDAARGEAEGLRQALGNANRVNAALSAAVKAMAEVLGQPVLNRARELVSGKSE